MIVSLRTEKQVFETDISLTWKAVNNTRWTWSPSCPRRFLPGENNVKLKSAALDNSDKTDLPVLPSIVPWSHLWPCTQWRCSLYLGWFLNGPLENRKECSPVTRQKVFHYLEIILKVYFSSILFSQALALYIFMVTLLVAFFCFNLLGKKNKQKTNKTEITYFFSASMSDICCSGS